MDSKQSTKRSTKLWVGGLLAACLLLCPATGFTGQQSDQSFSKSQVLLFNTPHLENVAAVSQLHYDVNQTGTLAHKIEDEIVLSITAINAEGGKNITAKFLSGDREKKFPGVEGFRGNALLLYFLEWDIEKMHDDRTKNKNKVHRQFFQHKMRNAFATAEYDTGSVSLAGGKVLRTRNVRMQPLIEAQGQPKYTHLWNKRYEFMLADEVPGGIYKIVTEIPGDKPEDPPKERMEITFNRIVPAEAHRNK